MKAEEAKTKTTEVRNRLVKEQLEDAHNLIRQKVDEGGFSVYEVGHRLASTRNVGWLDEVVETLKMEGYTVQLENGTLTISWRKVKEVEERPSLGVPKPPKDRKVVEGEVPTRPSMEPNLIKEDGGGIVPMVVAGLVISGLILLGLMFG